MEINEIHALVVDDSRISRLIVSETLRSLGVGAVYEAVNGQEAIDCLGRIAAINVVVLDWQMPVMDGIEFVRAVRAMSGHEDLFIMMLTMHSAEKYVLEAFSAGVSDYLLKPFSPEQFRKKIDRLLNRHLKPQPEKFGGYLQENGLISERQLAVTLECQKHLNLGGLSMATLAVICGFVARNDVLAKLQPLLQNGNADADLIRATFADNDMLAGLISDEQKEKLLDMKIHSRFMIGEVMVGLGIISADAMQQQLDLFLAARAGAEKN